MQHRGTPSLFRHQLTWCALIFCATAITVSASAQVTSTWQANGVASWNDPANWTSGVPNGTSDHAMFGPAFPDDKATVFIVDPTTIVGNLTYNNPFQIDLVAPTVTFEGDGSPALIEILDGHIYFDSGDYVLATDLAVSAQPGSTLTVGAELNPAASLSGVGGLSIQGGGDIILSGANSYQGVTNIYNGKLKVFDNNSLGLGTGSVLDGTFVHSGGILELSHPSIDLPDERIVVEGGTVTGGNWALTGPVQLNGGTLTGDSWTLHGTTTVNSGTLSGEFWYVRGPLILDGDLHISDTQAGTNRIFGQVSGSGGITLDAPDKLLIISNINTHAGQNIVDRGTLVVTHAQSLGLNGPDDSLATIVRSGGELLLTPGLRLGDEKIILEGGTLGDFSGGYIRFNGPIVSDGGVINAEDWSVSDVELTGSLTLDASINGSIGGVISGQGPLIARSGETVLSGSNTYNGQTIVQPGSTLTIQKFDALGTGSGTDVDATIVQAGGTLHIGSNADTVLTEKIILEGGTLYAGATEGPVELRSNGIVEATDLYGIVSGTGDLTVVGNSEYAETRLFVANTYTGKTHLQSGQLIVNHAAGLGDTGAGTTITGGTLTLNEPTNEPILVDGGVLFINTPIHPGPISVGTGIIGASNPVNNLDPVTINQTLDFIGGTAQLTASDSLTLAAGSSGRGVIQVGGRQTSGGTIVINSPLQHQGDVVIMRGGMEINTPFLLDGRWVLSHTGSNFFNNTGVLRVNVDVAGRLDMVGGDLEVMDGVSFTNLDPILELAGGSIDGNIVNLSRIVKSSYRVGWLDDIGADNDADVHVERGKLTVTGLTSLGSVDGITTVASKEAVLHLRTVDRISETIRLDNATGHKYQGGLLVDRSSVPAILAGTLDVGQLGSIINTHTPLLVEGPVTGSGFRLYGRGNDFEEGMILTHPDNALTGVINIGDDYAARLTLQDEGRLPSLTRVEIGSNGVLSFNDRGTANVADRLSDDVPVWLLGGDLEVLPSREAFTSERVGRVEAQHGASTVRVFLGASETDRAELNIGQFDRRAGATIDFDGEFAAADAPQPSRTVIRFDTPPPLINGIIGGWATTAEQTDFATYGTQGIAAYSDYETDLNAAGAASNISLSAGETLTQDKQINSLRLGYRGTLDLGGQTLNIASGGLLQVATDTTIENGTLTAGGDSAGELVILNDRGTVKVLADITDHPTGSVGLTLTAGETHLGGINTYSGDTMLARGTTRLLADTALPAGGNITVASGFLTSEYQTSDRIIVIGQVSIIGGGSLTVLNIDAENYTIHAGNLANIVGDGPVLKTTPGRGRLSFGDGYTGLVTIQQGVLELGTDLQTTAGSFVVLPDGQLEVRGDDSDIGSNLDLRGGVLSLILGSNPQVTYSGSIQVTADSQVHSFDSALISGDITGDADLSFWNTDATNRFSITYIRGDNSLYTGTMRVNSGVLVAQSEDAIGLGGMMIKRFGQIWAGTEIVRGNITLDGGVLGTEDFFYKGSTSLLLDQVVVASDSLIETTNELTLQGGLVLNNGAELIKTGSNALIVTGDFLIGQDTTLFGNEGNTIVTGTLVADAADATLDLLRADRFQLAGSIHIGSGQSLTITDNFTPIQLILNDPSQHVDGHGTLFNDLILSNGASINPGGSAGTFTVDGDYTQLIDAVMQIELGGTAPGQFDRLMITGLFSPGGVFELLLLDDYMPAPGDVFDVLDFNALASGQGFDQLRLPELDFGRDWDTSKLLVNGEIRVVPEPATGFGLGMLSVLLTRRWARHRDN